MDKDEEEKLEYCSLINADYSSKRGCTVWRATLNYLAVMFGGVGVLSFPFCILLSGWFAVVAMCVIPIVCCYTATLLMDCMYQTADQERIRVRFTWEDIAEACFPCYGTQLIVVTRCLHFLLICSMYLVVSGALLHSLEPLGVIDEAWWRVICSVIVLPTAFLTNWSVMVWMSLLSVFSLALACSAIMGVSINRVSTWTFASIAANGGTQGIFISINAILLGNNAHDMLPFIEESMADKKKINFVVFFSYGVSIPLKLLFSMFAFLTFTYSTKAIVLQNLPTNWISFVTFIPTVLSSLGTYAPTMYGIIITLDQFLDNYEKKQEKGGKVAKKALFALVRVLPVLTSLIIAHFVTNFALLCAFTSSILVSAYAYIFPAGFHLCLKFRELTYRQIIIDIILVITGFASAIIGATFSIIALIKTAPFADSTIELA